MSVGDCCGTCLHGGENYFTGKCLLDKNNPKIIDVGDWCGAWHRKD